MKVIIELPDNWLNTDLTGNIDWITRTVKDTVQHEIKEKVVEQVLSQTELPKIVITPEEVKDRMVTILAERALEERSS